MIGCVEDDASIREIELYTLRSTGFEAKGFEDGGAFLTALKAEKSDLMILNIFGLRSSLRSRLPASGAQRFCAVALS